MIAYKITWLPNTEQRLLLLWDEVSYNSTHFCWKSIRVLFFKSESTLGVSRRGHVGEHWSERSAAVLIDIEDFRHVCQMLGVG